MQKIDIEQVTLQMIIGVIIGVRATKKKNITRKIYRGGPTGWCRVGTGPASQEAALRADQELDGQTGTEAGLQTGEQYLQRWHSGEPLPCVCSRAPSWQVGCSGHVCYMNCGQA